MKRFTRGGGFYWMAQDLKITPLLAGRLVMAGLVLAIAANRAFGQQESPRDVLQMSISSPKECIVDRPCRIELKFVNISDKATADKLGLTVSYVRLPHPAGDYSQAYSAEVFINFGMPVRALEIALPRLGPNESHTVPVDITPRRTGQTMVSVRTSGPWSAKNVLGNAVMGVEFDSKSSVVDLFPEPKAAGQAHQLPQKLADVPEVVLDAGKAPAEKAVSFMILNQGVTRVDRAETEAVEYAAHTLEKMARFCSSKTDGFVEKLSKSSRRDVAGLPFALGDACRLTEQRTAQFVKDSAWVHSVRNNVGADHKVFGERLKIHTPSGQESQNDGAVSSRLAALMQIVAHEPAGLRLGTIAYLKSCQHADATRALANLALFSDEDEVRAAALEALEGRPGRDFGQVLVRGLTYPWPAVAQRASAAIVKLKREELLPELVECLERPDPRAPQTMKADAGKEVHIVRELVRINHLRHCALCHPSALVPDSRRQGNHNASVNATVPLPDRPVPDSFTPQGGYGHPSIPDILVRFDITYLRQDFSAALPVENARPWSDKQRFDFLVRSREVSTDEARVLRDMLKPAAGALSPYQNAALSALRQLTGRDAEPTAIAWRKVIGI